MNKLWLSLLAGSLSLGLCAEVICEVKTLKDVENRRPLALQEDGSFRVTKAAWVVGKQPIPADANMRLSASMPTSTPSSTKYTLHDFMIACRMSRSWWIPVHLMPPL